MASLGDGPDGIAALNKLGVFVGVSLTLLVAFQTIAPFFIEVPEVSQRLIDQQQTMLQTVFIALASYLWGSSVGRKQAEQTMNSMATAAASTAQTAAVATGAIAPAAIMPVPPHAPNVVTLEGSVTIKEPEDSGDQKVEP